MLTLEFQLRNGQVAILQPTAGVNSILLNDTPLHSTILLPPGNNTYTLKIGHRLSVFQVNPSPAWPPDFNPAIWQIFQTPTGEILGEAPPSEIFNLVSSKGWNVEHCAVCPQGLDTGFHLNIIADALSAPFSMTAQPAGDKGKFLCPACWLRFDAGDVLSIAVHESLRNDPVLGTDNMLRFQPTRFNDVGQALDPMGLPCTEIACPHCRRPLPPGFLDLPHKIFSLIGAPSSGKSYLLAVLTKVLQDQLFRDFHLVFKDGDPSGNMLLNQMRTKLFSGMTPEECVLGKTAMEGATYERLPRLGKWVALPRPFVYILSDGKTKKSSDAAIIFYDNAGEHFEPGHNIDDSPGALHVASSSGILFLYDPTSNPRFRQRLADIPDPQLRQHGRADQQDSILAEMEIRVKKMLGMAPTDKIPVPIAILVGKCDVWQSLLNARELPNPVRDGKLDETIIHANSYRIRELLAELCPGLVAQAESLSSDVRYFAVSSLGHSPSPLEDGPNAGLLAPDPKKINPIGVAAPAYWLFNKAMPNVIPAWDEKP
jgi:hypothetical protein